MVQKRARAEPSTPKGRGRPRSFDPDRALKDALGAFWRAGYSATSLDDLVAATGLHRPSLYGAFGDKQAIYLKALEHYWARSMVQLAEILSGKRPLADELRALYELALDSYIPAKGPPRGCFAVGTAVTEAVEDKAIRAELHRGLGAVDQAFADRLRLAHEQGEIPPSADWQGLSQLAVSTLLSLAIRARGGARREDLAGLVRHAVAIISAK